MTLLENDASPAKTTEGRTHAQRNWNANLAALAVSQPWIAQATGSAAPSITWVFARDGFLTAHDVLGHWWAECSLPKRAGLALLKKLDLRGVVGCFLAPTHAGQVAAALEKLQPHQAVLVIQPEMQDLRVLLGCCDFSTDISRNRLWLAAGSDWASMLTMIFQRHPGLPTPCQFIRTPVTSDDLVNQLIPAAEKVFNDVNGARTTRLQSLIKTVSVIKKKVSGTFLVLAASQFRLWDDAGRVLVDAVGTTDSIHLDPDDPAQASALGLALAAAQADAIIVPNRPRAELPAVLPAAVAVLSWITQPRIPAYDANHPRDALLLADESWLPAAQAAGWPKDRLELAGWPNRALPRASEKCLALIADTCTLETPTKLLELSSHHVLWELIRADLTDPFALGPDINAFINRRMAKLGISEEGFDRTMFAEKLVLPAYQQGLAKVLIKAGVPLKLYGKGWEQIPHFRGAWQGTVQTREEFRAAVQGASALVYLWPVRHRHAMDALNRPVLSPKWRRVEWLRDAKAILNASAPMSPIPAISRSNFRKNFYR